MMKYSRVSIPADVFERTKKALRQGKFVGRGYRSPSDAITRAAVKQLDEVGA